MGRGDVSTHTVKGPVSGSLAILCGAVYTQFFFVSLNETYDNLRINLHTRVQYEDFWIKMRS